MAIATTTLMLGLALGGTAIDAYGRIKAGRAAKRAGEKQQEASESQAQLAEFNASVADLQAKDALERGQEDAQQFGQKVRLLIGEQRADFAAAGVDVGFGSAQDVQADSAFLGELDRNRILNNAAREAWGYKVQGEDLRRRAEIARKEGFMLSETGRANQTAANWGAAQSILGGTSMLLDRYGFGKRSAA